MENRKEHVVKATLNRRNKEVFLRVMFRGLGRWDAYPSTIGG